MVSIQSSIDYEISKNGSVQIIRDGKVRYFEDREEALDFSKPGVPVGHLKIGRSYASARVGDHQVITFWNPVQKNYDTSTYQKMRLIGSSLTPPGEQLRNPEDAYASGLQNHIKAIKGLVDAYYRVASEPEFLCQFRPAFTDCESTKGRECQCDKTVENIKENLTE